jgi:rhodanese-related sulfurtransferase
MAKKPASKLKTPAHSIPRWAFWASIGLLVIVAGVVYWVSRQVQPGSADPNPTAALPAEISVEDAYVLFVSNSALFVDVRPVSDWKAYRIDKSVSIPADQFNERLSEIPQDRIIILVDAYGTGQARQVQSALVDAGYPRVTNIIGGLESWIQKRYPLIGIAPY